MTVPVRTDLAGRVALVTGGASGIGLACALGLARAGAVVAVADRDPAAAEASAADLAAEGLRAFAVQMDVSDEQSVQEGVAAIVRREGALHVAVNSAGVAGGAARTGDVTSDDWNRVIAVNLTGVFYCVRAEVGAIAGAGGGAIVNIGSVLSLVASQTGSAAYVAAKHGVLGLTKQAAIDHACDGIRINAVLPGYIETPLVMATLSVEQRLQRAARHPIGRLGQPYEVAALVVWLASDEASFVTASSFTVDGGFVAI